MKPGKSLLASGGCLAAVLVVGDPDRTAGQTPPESLADQVRAQGYPCDRLMSAERDAGQSRPNEAVWIIKCANAAYRMRVIPDMAARVEPLN
jgi:hypothetical protein